MPRCCSTAGLTSAQLIIFGRQGGDQNWPKSNKYIKLKQVLRCIHGSASSNFLPVSSICICFSALVCSWRFFILALLVVWYFDAFLGWNPDRSWCRSSYHLSSNHYQAVLWLSSGGIVIYCYQLGILWVAGWFICSRATFPWCYIWCLSWYCRWITWLLDLTPL